MGQPHGQLSGRWAGLGPRGLSWACQGSGHTQLLLPFPLGTSRSPTGVQQVPSAYLLSLWPLAMPQRPQGSDQFLLLLQEPLAVTAQQLL